MSAFSFCYLFSHRMRSGYSHFFFVCVPAKRDTHSRCNNDEKADMTTIQNACTVLFNGIYLLRLVQWNFILTFDAVFRLIGYRLAVIFV